MIKTILFGVLLLAAADFASAKPVPDKGESPKKPDVSKQEKKAEEPKTEDKKQIIAIARAQADKCAQSLVSGDYSVSADYMHDRILKQAGGREGMITFLKQNSVNMEARKFSFNKVEVGEPSSPLSIGSWQVSLIPQHLTLNVEGGTLLSKSFLIGVSEDAGKKWVFIDSTGYGQPGFDALFPELTGKLEIPKREKPVFTPKP